jgi:glycosyltransferase involved in cell wall biosynthesis
VTVSWFDRELLLEMERHPPDRVSVLYNGIEVPRFDVQLNQMEARRRSDLPHDKQLLAVIARLEPQKNHRGLFEALSLLPDDVRSEVHCLIVGSGYLEKRLRKEVWGWGLGNDVSFLEERKDVPTILKAIDVLVLPSHWECLPVVLLEALAAGCPIVATCVGGVPEVLAEVGWPLVGPNDPQGLAEAITEVLCMPETRRRSIAGAGRRTVKRRFSRQVAAAEAESLYESLLSDARHRRSGSNK